MKKIKKRISVVGAGYVGIAVSIVLSEKNDVVIYDINQEKVDLMNSGISPINDPDMNRFFKDIAHKNNVIVTSDIETVLDNVDFVVLAVPTNWDEKSHHLDIRILCDVIQKIEEHDMSITVIIKSTLPVGTMDYLSTAYSRMRIIYVPEFLREGEAVKDEKNLSRLVIGVNESCNNCVPSVQNLFLETQRNLNVPVMIMTGTEAELVKLYSNAYLALRVSFFNELDTYAELKNLNSQKIISAVSLDPRIGNYYNVPSFGYGGYCLPKDSREIGLLYKTIPSVVIPSIVKANKIRKEYIANRIIDIVQERKLNHPIIGIFRVNMKRDADNCREAAILDIISILRKQQYTIVVYEPLLKEMPSKEVKILNDLQRFKQVCDIIVANRMSSEIVDVVEKVYTRDIY